MDEAEVEEIISGLPRLQLLKTGEYPVISWEGGVLVAQAVDSSGTRFESHHGSGVIMSCPIHTPHIRSTQPRCRSGQSSQLRLSHALLILLDYPKLPS